MVPPRFGTSMVTNKHKQVVAGHIKIHRRDQRTPLSSPALRPSSGQNANEHHQIQITK